MSYDMVEITRESTRTELLFHKPVTFDSLLFCAIVVASFVVVTFAAVIRLVLGYKMSYDMVEITRESTRTELLFHKPVTFDSLLFCAIVVASFVGVTFAAVVRLV